MNWFWNQWFYGNGHPKVDINYNYDAAKGQVLVYIKQKQTDGKIFNLPIGIDIYTGKDKKRYNLWTQNKADTFTFTVAVKPNLVNVDADKITLWMKKDNKTLDNYIHQYKYAGNYIDRREAIEFAAKKTDDPKAVELLKTALTDKYHGLRSLAISKADLRKEAIKTSFEPVLATIAKTDKKAVVRAAAIAKLGEYKKTVYADLFKSAVNDSSYTVAGNALAALQKVDAAAATALVKKLADTPKKGVLQEVVRNEIW